MEREIFNIDYDIQQSIKIALEMAIYYCEDNLQKADSWSKEGLQNHLNRFNILKDDLGKSFVIGHFE